MVGLMVLAVYVAIGVVLYLIQDRLVYPAPGGIGRSSLDQAASELGAAPLDLMASDGTRLYGWHLRSTGSRLVLYLHGNGEAVTDYVPLYRILLHDGWDVLAVAYRGYPGSEGAPTEAGLALDAEAAWAWATGPGGYPPDRVVVHGRSLGGGVAATLVDGPANPAGMVLESTFADLREVARRAVPMYPVGLLLRARFDTRSRAPRLGVPVLLMHSTDDQVIPIDLGGRALRGVIAEVEYEETSGLSHQQCLPVSDARLRRVYLSFLDRVVPRAPSGDRAPMPGEPGL
ncbi:MAG: alpha/beta hydrolase [Myxococcota bacterium]